MKNVPSNLISYNKLVGVGGDDDDVGGGARELGLVIPVEEGRWGLGFLGVRVLKGKKGEWGWRTNAELGAMVALGRRWRDDIGKGRVNLGLNVRMVVM